MAYQLRITIGGVTYITKAVQDSAVSEAEDFLKQLLNQTNVVNYTRFVIGNGNILMMSGVLAKQAIFEIIDVSTEQQRLDAEIKELCSGDHPIRVAAVKLYRERTGSSLMDAKNYVDKLCPPPDRIF